MYIHFVSCMLTTWKMRTKSGPPAVPEALGRRFLSVGGGSMGQQQGTSSELSVGKSRGPAYFS